MGFATTGTKQVLIEGWKAANELVAIALQAERQRQKMAKAQKVTD
jgi:hypothetical protein